MLQPENIIQLKKLRPANANINNVTVYLATKPAVWAKNDHGYYLCVPKNASANLAHSDDNVISSKKKCEPV